MNRRVQLMESSSWLAETIAVGAVLAALAVATAVMLTSSTDDDTYDCARSPIGLVLHPMSEDAGVADVEAASACNSDARVRVVAALTMLALVGAGVVFLLVRWRTHRTRVRETSEEPPAEPRDPDDLSDLIDPPGDSVLRPYDPDS